jgi:hypothetical protein
VGALLDATALQVMWDRGLGELTGVRLRRAFDNGVWERFTDHPLNGSGAQDGRDARLSFWRSVAWQLDAAGERDKLGDIAHLVSYDDTDCGMCLATYENSLGGRVVTMTYAPWTRLKSSAKRSQLINLVDWATRGRLPLLIERASRVVPFVRMSTDRKRCVTVLAMVRPRSCAYSWRDTDQRHDHGRVIGSVPRHFRVSIAGTKPVTAKGVDYPSR